MTEFFNRHSEKEKRLDLRNNLAPAESRLWARLRRKEMHERRFRRQYSVGPYVVDFYCPALKLAIELDGESHLGEEAREHDRVRQSYIERFGISFRRFTNTEVFEDLEGVLAAIEQTIMALKRESNPPVVPPS